MKFLSSQVDLYLYKSTIWPCMGYCCHVWLLFLVITWKCWISYKNRYAGLLVLCLLPLLSPCLTVKIQPAKVCSIDIALEDIHLNWLNWFHSLILEGGVLVILIDCMIFLSLFLDVKLFLFSHRQNLEFSAQRMFSFGL